MGDVFTVFAGDIVVGVGSQGIAALGALQRHFCKNVYVLLLCFFSSFHNNHHICHRQPQQDYNNHLGKQRHPSRYILTKETRVVSLFKLKTAVSYCRLFFEHRLRSYRRFFSDTLISSKR